MIPVLLPTFVTVAVILTLTALFYYLCDGASHHIPKAQSQEVL